MKIKFNVDNWNSKPLVINGKQYDLNIYADGSEAIKIIIMECEQGADEFWYTTDREVYNEYFFVGAEVVQDRPDTPDIDSIAERNYENRRT